MKADDDDTNEVAHESESKKSTPKTKKKKKKKKKKKRKKKKKQKDEKGKKKEKKEQKWKQKKKTQCEQICDALKLSNQQKACIIGVTAVIILLIIGRVCMDYIPLEEPDWTCEGYYLIKSPNYPDVWPKFARPVIQKKFKDDFHADKNSFLVKNEELTKEFKLHGTVDECPGSDICCACKSNSQLLNKKLFTYEFRKCMAKDSCVDSEENYDEDCVNDYEDGRDQREKQRMEIYGLFFVFSFVVVLGTAGVIFLYYLIGMRYFKMPYPKLIWVFDPTKHEWQEPEAIEAAKTARKPVALFQSLASKMVGYNKRRYPWTCPLCSLKNEASLSKCAVCPGLNPEDHPPPAPPAEAEEKKEQKPTKLRKLMDLLHRESGRKNSLKGKTEGPPPAPSSATLVGTTVPLREVVLATHMTNVSEHCNSLNGNTPVISTDGSVAVILQGNRLMILSGSKRDKNSVIVMPKRENQDGTKTTVSYSYGPTMVATVHLHQTHYSAVPAVSADGGLIVAKNLREYFGFSREGALLWRYKHQPHDPRDDVHDASHDTSDDAADGEARADPSSSSDSFVWVKSHDIVGTLDTALSGAGTYTIRESDEAQGKSKPSQVAPEPEEGEEDEEEDEEEEEEVTITPNDIMASFDGVKTVRPPAPDPFYGEAPVRTRWGAKEVGILEALLKEMFEEQQRQRAEAKKMQAKQPVEGEGETSKSNEKKEESKTSESKTSESKTSESKTSESKTSESKTSESKTSESKTSESETNEPVMELTESGTPELTESGTPELTESGTPELTESGTPEGPRTATTSAKDLPVVCVRSRIDFLLHGSTPPRVSRDGRLVLAKYERELVFLDGASGVQVGCIQTREFHIDSLPWVEADPFTEWGYLVCGRDGTRVKMWHCTLQEFGPATISLMWEYKRPGKVGRGVFPHAPRISADGTVVIFRWQRLLISLDAQGGWEKAKVDCPPLTPTEGGGQVGMSDDATLVCCVEGKTIVARDGHTLETLWIHKARNGFFEPFTPVVSAAGDIVLFKVWSVLVWLDGRNGSPVITRNCDDTSCIPGGATDDGRGVSGRVRHLRDTYLQNTFGMAADASYVVAKCSKGSQVLCFHVNECYRGEILAQSGSIAPVMPKITFKSEKVAPDPKTELLPAAEAAGGWEYEQKQPTEAYSTPEAVYPEEEVAPSAESAVTEYNAKADAAGPDSFEDDGNWELQEPIDNPSFWLNTVTGETRWPDAAS